MGVPNKNSNSAQQQPKPNPLTAPNSVPQAQNDEEEKIEDAKTEVQEEYPDISKDPQFMSLLEMSDNEKKNIYDE